MKFRVRVDSSLSVSDFVQPYSSHVVVHHILPHGNPHYHMYIEDTQSLSVDALRKRVDRYFNVKGPQRSIKVCDDSRVNEYVQYLFNEKHGNKATLVSTGNFDSTLLLQLQAQAKDVANEFTSRQKSKSDKGPSQYDLAEEVKDRLKDLHKQDYSIEDYTRSAIQVMRKHRKAFCKFSLGRIIMTAMKDDEIVQQMQNYFHTM